jgi:hypothetical protein
MGPESRGLLLKMPKYVAVGAKARENQNLVLKARQTTHIGSFLNKTLVYNQIASTKASSTYMDR